MQSSELNKPGGFYQGLEIKQSRSCKICGFLVENETAVGNIGYCLYYDDLEKAGESLKIPDGAEKEIASTCRHYFRRVPTITQGEFIQWRTNLEVTAGQRRIRRTLNIIAILGFMLSLASYLTKFIGI